MPGPGSRSLAKDADFLFALDLDGEVVEVDEKFLQILRRDTVEIEVDPLFLHGLIELYLFPCVNRDAEVEICEKKRHKNGNPFGGACIYTYEGSKHVPSPVPRRKP